jgi:hypothetical protein
MNAQLQSLSAARGAQGLETGDIDMIRFSIAPTPAGAWLWRTFLQNGNTRAQGLAATRKQAAALVIRDILLTQRPSVADLDGQVSAKAA